MIDMTLDDKHVVFDGDRMLQFEGRLIGHASSRMGTHNRSFHQEFQPGDRCPACRWIEFDLYLTSGGHYVLHTQGKTIIAGEKTRNKSQVSRTPEGIIAGLELYDQDGVKYLTHVARALLEDASVNDDGVHNAFMVTTIE